MESIKSVRAVTLLAEELFEDEAAALLWMSSPNQALGGNSPAIHCKTATGVQQVRRILNALEYGGAA